MVTDRPHVALLESQPCSLICAERVGRLQKQCQDLQRHLEKACRQLQHTVRENKAGTLRLKGTAPAGGAPEPLTLLLYRGTGWV